MDSKIKLTSNQEFRITWILLFLMPIIGMAIDIVAPSLPSIAISLHTSEKLSKDVISIYLLGYGVGNFLVGSATDSFGRRNILRISVIFFILVTLLPPIFPHITVLLIVRFLQGVLLGIAALVTRAIFADILPAEKLVRLGTLIATMWGMGPVLGPVIGGYLQYYFGWQAGFYFLAIIGFIDLIFILAFIPETNTRRQLFNYTTIKNNTKLTLLHRRFIGFAMMMGLAYALIIIFQTAGPFLIQNSLHHSPVYFGHLALMLGIVFLISTFCVRYLIKQYPVNKIYFICINALLIVAILGVIFSYYLPYNISYIILISSLMFFACGFLFPMSMGQGLAYFQHVAGTATAVMYLINISLTSLASYLIGFVNMTSAIPMMLAYLAIVILCSIVYWVMIHVPVDSKE